MKPEDQRSKIGDGGKQKFPWVQAIEIALGLAKLLAPTCEKITVAGSLRRKKREVGDIELLYIPRLDEAKLPGEMFAQAEQNMADLAIEQLITAGVLAKRVNVKGREMFGAKNKLMRHVPSGIPVDLFAASYYNWFNYLVCRTGGAENNIAICNAAIARGWQWNPYGPGFSRASAGDEVAMDIQVMESERDVFEFVGLPWLEPEDRA